MFLVPPPFIKSASGITMTAGTASIYAGYSNGVALPVAFGSVTSEPLAGETLSALFSSGTNSAIYYANDIVATLSALTLYVDGTPYSLAGAVFNGSFTYVTWSGGSGPSFTDGISYTIRIE